MTVEPADDTSPPARPAREPGDGGQVLPAVIAATAAVSLRLITPRALAEGLKLIGYSWSPRPEDADHGTDHGLYTWVDGLSPNTDPLDCGILYIGIGEGDDGAIGRTGRERRWLRDAAHAHGLAIARRSARAVLGPVTPFASVDLSWAEQCADLEELDPEGLAAIRAWRSAPAAGAGSKSHTKRAEAFAVRLSIHAGDTVAPVNSQYASAWRNDTPADWAAYAVAKRLRDTP